MDNNVIKCIIPKTVSLGKSKISDVGVISNQDFNKGDFIYENSALLLDINKVPQKISLQTDQGVYELDKHLHSSYFDKEKYMFYNFDSFTNHSCDPNTNCIKYDEEDPCKYRCTALKDIKKGDELNANYNCFYYEIDIPFDCACGAKNCCGKVQGFKNLSIEQQKEIYNDLDNSFFTLYNLDYLKN